MIKKHVALRKKETKWINKLFQKVCFNFELHYLPTQFAWNLPIQSMCIKEVVVFIFLVLWLIGPPPLGEKGSYDFITVSISVFLKLVMKLGCLKGKKLTEPDLVLCTMPKNRVFGFYKKKKPLMYRFLGFKSCTIMTFMILLKPFLLILLLFLCMQLHI